jgi:hypothetical protein
MVRSSSKTLASGYMANKELTTYQATNNAQAEVAPLKELAETLERIKAEGSSAALSAYVRNQRIPLLRRARRIVQSTGTPAYTLAGTQV